MTVHTLQVNTTRGELTPLVHGRVDSEHYAAGLKRLRNGVVMRYGGVTRAPGTIYMGLGKLDGLTNNPKEVWIPFKFNRTQVYAIETVPAKFLFWNLDGQVLSGGLPYEVAHPYVAADLPNIQYRQLGDVIYLTCLGYQPRTLTRISETNWVLALYVPIDGPYLDVNETDTTLTPASTGSLTPIMTNNTTPSGTVADSAGSVGAYLLFDGDRSGQYLVGSASGWTSYTFASGTKVSDAYWLVVPVTGDLNGAPSEWTIEGYDGSGWVVLDSRSGETGWAAGEKRYYEFTNKAAYEAYRFNWKALNGITTLVTSELRLNEAGDGQTPFNLTASSTTGINDGAGFLTTDVGRSIRLLGSDGKWRWARITSRTSSTVVKIRMYGHALPDTSPIVNWRLGAWSDHTGWPARIGIYEDRLVLARTDNDPVAGWCSVNGDYDNFRQSSPIVPDDAVSFRLTGGELNEIMWIADDNDILLGTGGSLRAVGRNDAAKAFAQDNVRQRNQTTIPTSVTRPIQIEGMTLFLDSFQTRVYEAAFDYNTDRYQARELTALNEHIVALGVTRWCYQDYPQRIMWGVTSTGELAALTYDREQKVFGVGLVDVGADVLDVVALPGEAGSEVMLLTKRTVDGAIRTYVEKLAEFYRDDTSVLGVPVYGDCCSVKSSGAASATINVPQLADETVGVWADGRDLGDVTVSALGVATLPLSLTAELIVVGKRRTFEARTLRLPESGNRDGSALGRRMRAVGASIDLFETPYMKVGAGGELDDLRFEDEPELDPFEAPELRTGMFRLPTDDSWSNNGEIVMQTDRMYPATIRAISVAVEGEP
jgi:hypothetical protein